MKMNEPNATTIFERLGGMSVINRTVDTFYERISTDSLLSPFFADVCIARQRAKLKAFLMMVLDGPKVYTGRTLREAHRSSVQRGLDDEHMDKIVELLGVALLENGAASDDVDQVAAIANSVRDEILNR